MGVGAGGAQAGGVGKKPVRLVLSVWPGPCSPEKPLSAEGSGGWTRTLGSPFLDAGSPFPDTGAHSRMSGSCQEASVLSRGRKRGLGRAQPQRPVSKRVSAKARRAGEGKGSASLFPEDIEGRKRAYGEKQASMSRAGI